MSDKCLKESFQGFFFNMVCWTILSNSFSQCLIMCWWFNSFFSFWSINNYWFSVSYFMYTADASLYSSCSSSNHISLAAISYMPCLFSTVAHAKERSLNFVLRISVPLSSAIALKNLLFFLVNLIFAFLHELSLGCLLPLYFGFQMYC